MTASQLLANLDHRDFFHIRPGLDAIRKVLDALHHPERRFAAIHIAGTNGKGSVGAMLERILREAGYRTGLYSSPHLIRIHERIQINGQSISSRTFLRLGLRVLKAEKNCCLRLTYFEFVTVIAFLYFAEAGVAAAIVECGLGGLWDATNVLPRPILGIITSIGLDHTAWLGKTEQTIAAEKAGIIKEGMTIISGVRGPGKAVIERQSARLRTPIFRMGTDFRGISISQDWSHPAHQWAYIGKEAPKSLWTTRLMGFHQADNAAIVYCGIEILRDLGWAISDHAVGHGFQNVLWPGRLQLIRSPGRPAVLIDGAHNPPAMRKLVHILKSNFFIKRPISFVFSAFRDKDIQSMAAEIQTLNAPVFLSSMGGERSATVADLQRITHFPRAIFCAGGPVDALNRAMQATPANGTVVVAGSLMQAGLLLKHLKQHV